MANKYLDLAGLQSYNELLLTDKLAASVGHGPVIYGTVTPQSGDPYKAFTTVKFSVGTSGASEGKIIKETEEVVDIATLKTDLGIGTAGVTAVVTDDTANSIGKVKVTTDGVTNAVAISGIDYTGTNPVLSNGLKLETGMELSGALSSSPTDNAIATVKYVKDAVEELPQAMIFRGTLGESATISSLPTASASTVGDVYKVITKGTYDGQSAEIGDLFVCAQSGTSPNFTYAWVLIPSGDVPSGTVTSVAATGDDYITVSGSPITDSGTLTFTHATQTGLPETAQGDTSAQTPAFGSTFKALSATVDTAGHVTALSEHTVTIPATIAGSDTLGLVKQGDNVTINDTTGAISANQSGLVTESGSSDVDKLGVVKGSRNNGVLVDSNGVLSIATISTTSGGDIDSLFA